MIKNVHSITAVTLVATKKLKIQVHKLMVLFNWLVSIGIILNVEMRLCFIGFCIQSNTIFLIL